MGNASPPGHMPYPVDNLGQPSTGCSPQCGYMSYPRDSQHPTYAGVASWSQAPSQLGVNMPEYHQAVQLSYAAPLLPGVRMEPEFNQPFQFQDCQAFDSRSQTQDSYTQGHTESQKRSAQYLKQVALQGTEQELLPKYLYFSQFPTWAEFYRKFLNYARDMDWSAKECRKNMGYVLDGRVAEYFHAINEQEPNLPYYDLVIRLEDFVKELWSQGVVSPVNMGNNQNLTYNRMQFSPVPMYPGNPDFPPSPNITPGPQYSVLETCSQSNGYTPYNGSHNDNNLTDTQIHYSTPAYISHQSGSSLRLFSSSVEENCSQKEIYTPYKDPHSVTNSFIGSQSIDTDIVSSSYCGCTFNETKESDTGTAFESKSQCPQRQSYVPYRGSNKEEPFERLESSAESEIKQEDQTTCSLSDRMARLEEMFSSITELTDTHLSRQRKSEKHSAAFHNTQTPSSQDFSKFALHDPQVTLLHDPLISAPHGPLISQVHDPHTTALHDQQTSSRLLDPQTPMHDPIPTKQEEKSVCHGNMKVERSSVTRDFRYSMEEDLRIQSLVEYAVWLDGISNRPVGASTPNDERIWVVPEYEDLFDHDFGENDNGECSLSQLFSEKAQIVSNAPIPGVSADLQTTQVVANGSPASHQEVQELSSVHTEIQESNSEAVEFWWDSLDTKQPATGDEKDSVASCEDYIDGMYMYFELFGTTTIDVETFSTSESESEAWLDQRFADTFYSASLQDSSYRDKSVREEVTPEKPETKSPAQQEQNSSICSAELPAASLHGVTPYAAWNPSLDSEKNLSPNSKGNPSLDSGKESCMDSSGEDFTSCQLSSSATLRIPVILQGIALKAVVDTAATVTIVSDKVYRQWTVNPPSLKPATLKLAGRDNKIEGHVVGPVTLKLGSTVFPVVVHVAPIHSDMLVGLDFLLQHGLEISLNELYLLIRADKERIPLEIAKSQIEPCAVSKVTLELLEITRASPTVKNSHLQERAHCILQQPREITRTNSTSAWPQSSHSMPFQPTGPFDPSWSDIQGASLRAIPLQTSTLKAGILEAKFKRASELSFLLPFRLKIVTTASDQKHMREDQNYQSTCLALQKASVLGSSGAQQHWLWDPGGELSNNLSKGGLYTVLALGPVCSLYM